MSNRLPEIAGAVIRALEMDSLLPAEKLPAAHYIALTLCTDPNQPLEVVDLNLARCETFVGRRVPCLGPALMQILRETGASGAEHGMGEVFLTMVARTWHPKRIRQTGDLLRMYVEQGYVEPDAVVKRTASQRSPLQSIPSVERAAYLHHFEAMYVLLEMGARAVRDDFDLYTTIADLNLPDGEQVAHRAQACEVRFVERCIELRLRAATAAAPTVPGPLAMKHTQRRLRL